MAKGVKLPEALTDAVLARLREGVGLRAVQEEFGLAETTVVQLVHRAGCDFYRARPLSQAEEARRRQERAQVLALRAEGLSYAKIGARLGFSGVKALGICNSVPVTEFFHRGRSGGAVVKTGHNPCRDMACGTGKGRRITLLERHEIARRLGTCSAATIAADLGLSRQSVAREVKRHALADGTYDAVVANHHAMLGRSRPKARKIEENQVLRAVVVTEMATSGASPQQVSQRLAEFFGDDESMQISHESIYQALYVQGRGSLREEIELYSAYLKEQAQHQAAQEGQDLGEKQGCEHHAGVKAHAASPLRSGRTKRKKRSPLAGMPKPQAKKHWLEGAAISQRPPEADDRAVPGHWEGDLILGAGNKSALVTLVERHSRFTLMHRLGVDHKSQTVTEALKTMIASLPEAVFSTLTWDQGSEMATCKELVDQTDIQVFFADPHSPWQRPSNENTNGLIREYFPKGTDFSQIGDWQVSMVQDMLNRRPRLVLNAKRPSEVMAETITVL